MTQSVKYFIVLLLSLFLHLLILQIHPDQDVFYSADHSTIELGLVPFSQSRKAAVPHSAKTSLDKLSQPQIPDSSVAESSVSSVGSTISVEKGDLLPEQPVVDTGGEMISYDPKGEEPPTSKLLNTGPSSSGSVNLSDSKKYVGRDQFDLTEKNNRDLEKQKSESRPADIDDENLAARVKGLETNALPSNQADSALINADNNVDSLAMSEKKITTDVPVAIPRYERNPHPVYPDIALRKGWEGLVLLRVDVKADGFVKSVEIDESSGYNALDRAALKAVRRWQFFPAMSAGLPISGSAMVPINFDIP